MDGFKFVVIGTGNISNTYINAIGKIEGADVVACVSGSLKKPGAAPNLPSYKTLDDIDMDFDAVIICTPNGLHHVSAIKAAELGKHVFCEKPVDISLQAVDAMIKASRNNSVNLGVAYQRRYSSDNPAVKTLIDNGKLGKVFSVDLSVKNYRDDAYYNSSDYRGTYALDGGGPFIQQASHYIDLYYWLFGKPEKLVSQLGTFVHDIEVEDHGAVICKHKNGMIGTITASTATKPGFPARLEIFTEKGCVFMENDVITYWEIEGVENPGAQKHSKNTHSGSSSAAVNDTTNHEFLLKDFIDSVKTCREPLISGESARFATEMILDIYKGSF